MTITESMRSKINQGEIEGMANMLQEIIRKLDAFDTRLVAVENGAHKSKGRRDDSEEEDKGCLMAKIIKR